MADLRIGISGWNYPMWRGLFYPRGLVQRRELQYAANIFNSIEINGSFYSLKKPTDYEYWRDQAPSDFVYAVKGGRFITQMKKLRDVEIPLANFFASGVLKLGEKLGPILWQFPKQLGFLPERFERFLELLPCDVKQAAKLARHHDENVRGRAWIPARVRHNRTIRHAFETRHPSYVCDEFVAMLRRHNVAWVFADTAKQYPYAEDITADFVYVRLHGSAQLYASRYTDDELAWWAKRIRIWLAGGEATDAIRCSQVEPASRTSRDVYVYFDNDANAHAPFDAMRLREMLL